MKDPYASGMFKENPYYAKSDIQSSVVVILQGKLEERGLQIIKPISRGVRRYEVHELIVTDEAVELGGTVDKIAYLGFVEIQQGGVITVGDAVIWGGKVIGHIAGFDETHMPNHQNIVIYSEERFTGVDCQLQLGDSLTFRKV